MEITSLTTKKHQITAIKPQQKNQNRVNIFVDNTYEFSLSISQLVDQKLKVGQQLDEAQLAALKKLSNFGKLYTRTLEWLLSRPHSTKETRDYLYRKNPPKRQKLRPPLGRKPQHQKRRLPKTAHSRTPPKGNRPRNHRSSPFRNLPQRHHRNPKTNNKKIPQIRRRPPKTHSVSCPPGLRLRDGSNAGSRNGFTKFGLKSFAAFLAGTFTFSSSFFTTTL